MKKVAAIVVTYNRKELLRECLQALLAQTISNLDILLIDNASTDGTKEYIADIVEANPSICYMNTGSNLGGAGGFHYGLKKAYEMGYEIRCSLPDTGALLPAISFAIPLMARESTSSFKNRFSWIS